MIEMVNQIKVGGFIFHRRRVNSVWCETEVEKQFIFDGGFAIEMLNDRP